MRLTETRIRQIIREALTDRVPEFAPGAREKLIAVLKRLEPAMRKEVEESTNPKVQEYLELALDPDVVDNAFDGNDEAADAAIDVADRDACIALAENPPSSISAGAKMANGLVWSRWIRGQGAAPEDAAEFAASSEDDEKLLAIELISFLLPAPVGPEFSNKRFGYPKTMEEWVDALPGGWINRIFMARMEAGADYNQANL